MTQPTPEPELDNAREDVARELVDRWHELDAERARIVEAQASLKLDLIELLGDGTHDVGASTVSVRPPSRRFDPKLAAQVVPPELVPVLSTTQLDRELVQRALPPDTYARCMAPGKGSAVVTIK